jgi:hypothetical protein
LNQLNSQVGDRRGIGDLPKKSRNIPDSFFIQLPLSLYAQG